MDAVPPGLVVVLTGPPGSGKTTVAGLLVAGAPRAVHVAGDAFWHFIKRGWVAPYLDGSQHQNGVVVAALGAAAAEYAAGGYFTVLDTIVGPWLLGKAVGPVARRRLAVAYVVLRPSADVAMARAVGRSGGDLRDPEPVRKMYEAFADLGPFEQYVVDSSFQTPEETAEEVRARLREGSAVLDVGMMGDWQK